jgi:hypothetical protein
VKPERPVDFFSSSHSRSFSDEKSLQVRGYEKDFFKTR